MNDTRATAPERAILVGLIDGVRPGVRSSAPGRDPHPAGDPSASLDELALLTRTAGGEVVGILRMRRGSVHPATFLSKGKMAELTRMVADSAADLVIFDDDLSPAQARNLEKAIDRKIIDRTELILDIFARRARTREAQLQVELAQLQYLLPRLTRMWVHLSRLGGGIGTRGPGETQLEVDRRRVRERIALFKRRLASIEKEREVQSRRRRWMFRTSLVGYTNAGKSTLFNALTRAGVLEEDLLFATLETTTRRLYLGNGDGLVGNLADRAGIGGAAGEDDRLAPAVEGAEFEPIDRGFDGRGETILISDTVGFIRKLPHHLVASFRATLREVRESDLLIHVVDASQPNFPAQMQAVEEVVSGLLDGQPVSWVLVLNKADLLTEESRFALRAQYPDAQLLSARDPIMVQGFRRALARLARELPPAARRGRR